MRGGLLLRTTGVDIMQSNALRKVAAGLLAINVTWSSGMTYPTAAHPGHDESDCTPHASSEQSIVISAKTLVDAQDSPDGVTAGGEAALQPIANVSPNVPDLAEPDPAEPPVTGVVPALADTKTAQLSEVSTPLEKSIEKIAQREVRTAAVKQEPVAQEQVTQESVAQEPVILKTKAKAEVISFHGITPGLSKRINVLRGWGDPRSDDTQADELVYRFDDLPSVIVQFDESLVEAIVVKLGKPQTVAKLAAKLDMLSLRPTMVIDEVGDSIGQIYPERGVEFRFDANEQGLAIASDDEDPAGEVVPRVSEIVITPILAEPFLSRAADNLPHHFTNAMADFEAALKADRSLPAARAQLSEINMTLGRGVTAERYAAEAVEAEPQNPEYRLQWAKSLRQLARYDLAVQEARTVLETPNITPLVRAQALNEMGLLASLGSQKVARRAMSLHSKAIELADSVAVGDDRLEAREAKKLLVEAHLAVAVEISLGAWQQKDETVPQWIERASALAEALIDEDESYLPLRLQVAVSSLAAAANLEKPINPLLWVEEAEDTVAEIKATVMDPLAASQYDWQLGLAYFHASQIEHRRSEPDSSIHLGELADQQLAELAKDRDEMPDTAYLMGRLYFQIGAVHAVHYEDHVTACQWYDEAVGRLLNPVPVTTMVAPQQHGDALVSMGVSYWTQDNRQRAIEVTQAGVELIEQAVDSGLLEQETLMVSYNNLSAMYQAQGEKEPAARYEQLASRISGTRISQQQKPKQKSKLTRTARR